MSDEDLIVDAAIIALRKQMEAKATTQLALFVDPWVTDPIGGMSEARPLERVELPLRVDGYPEDKRPYLLLVPDEIAHERFVNATVHAGVAETLAGTADGGDGVGARSACAWIIGEVPVPVRFADTLTRFATIRRPDRRRHPLRYWDPRVVPHLHRVLEPGHYATLRSAMGNWLFLDLAARLVAPQPAVSPTGTEHATETTWHVSAGQWRRLSAIGLINQVLAQARGWGLHDGSQADIARLAPQLETALHTAENLGYGTEQDMLVFCACALTVHPRFYTHPSVTNALEAGKRRGATLADAVSSFDDAFWADVRAGRWLDSLLFSEANQ